MIKMGLWFPHLQVLEWSGNQYGHLFMVVSGGVTWLHLNVNGDLVATRHNVKWKHKVVVSIDLIDI